MRLVDKLDAALGVIGAVIVTLVLNGAPQWVMLCAIVVAAALGAVERTRLDRERGRGPDGRQ